MLASDVMMKANIELGHVQRVLAGWTGPEYAFNAVFPRGRVTSPKVRAFVDFLVDRLNFDADYMQVMCPDRKRFLAAQEASRVAKAELSKARRKAVAMPLPEGEYDAGMDMSEPVAR